MQENHFPERVQFTIYNCSTSRLGKKSLPEGHGFSRVPMSLRLIQGDENRVSACALLAAWERRSQRRARV